MAALRKRRAVAETEQSADSQAQLEFENTVNESNETQESMGENQLEKSADDSEDDSSRDRCSGWKCSSRQTSESCRAKTFYIEMAG